MWGYSTVVVMTSSDRHARAPISGPRTTRWTKAARAADSLGHFVVGAVPGFLAGLITGRIGLAALIGCVTGLVWLLAKVRLGNRLDSSLNLSPDQVASRARARANGFMGPGLG